MMDVKGLEAAMPKVWSMETRNGAKDLFLDAKYFYEQSLYGCDCLDGYYAARKAVPPEAAGKLAACGEAHYAGLVTVLTALLDTATGRIWQLYGGQGEPRGGVMDVMDRTTDLSDCLAMMMKSRGEDTGPADPTGGGFEGPAGEMARRSVGIGAVVERYGMLDAGTMLDAGSLDGTYMVLRGMLTSGCDVMRYVLACLTGERLPPAPSPDEAGCPALVGPLAASVACLADKMGT